MRSCGASALLAAILLAGTAAHAQPERSLDEMIAEAKTGIDEGCRARGKQRGFPPEQTEITCSCMQASLEKNMTRERWREFMARVRTPDGAQALKDLLALLTPDGQACVRARSGQAN